MAKAPEPGLVKTRLCPPLSPVQAAEFGRCLLRDKVEQIRAIQHVSCWVAYSPVASGHLLDDIVPPEIARIPQVGRDLSERLHNLFIALFATGVSGVIAMDADSPTLPGEYLQGAVDHLRRGVDVVLGPALDGGYYLIGLRAPERRLFDGMAWSTNTVCNETILRARSLGKKVVILDAWYDVDTASDLDRLARELRAMPTRIRARHTAQFLASHSLI